MALPCSWLISCNQLLLAMDSVCDALSGRDPDPAHAGSAHQQVMTHICCALRAVLYAMLVIEARSSSSTQRDDANKLLKA